MNEFKGTPGPWLLEQTTIYALNNERVPVNRFTASVDRGWRDDGKRIGQQEVEANARLIAAAPKLYAALARLTQAAQDADIGYLDAAVAEGWDALELVTSNSN